MLRAQKQATHRLKRRLLRATVILTISGVILGAGRAEATDYWPDTPLARAQSTAALEALEIALLSHDSATLTLDKWCADHHLAPSGSLVTAHRVTDVDKPLPQGERRNLAISDKEPVKYRRVLLQCGAVTLSEADNWYVPARLTPEMNRALDTTNTAFGRVVMPLHFQRRLLSAKMLWTGLPAGWGERHTPTLPVSSGMLDVPAYVIENRAILTLPDGTGFSEVVETYTKHVLDFHQ